MYRVNAKKIYLTHTSFAIVLGYWPNYSMFDLLDCNGINSLENNNRNIIIISSLKIYPAVSYKRISF